MLFQGGLDSLSPPPPSESAQSIFASTGCWEKSWILEKWSIFSLPEYPYMYTWCEDLIRIQIVCHFRTLSVLTTLGQIIVFYLLHYIWFKTCHLLITFANSFDQNQVLHSVRAVSGSMTVWHFQGYDKLKLNRYILTLRWTFTWHCQLLIILCKQFGPKSGPTFCPGLVGVQTVWHFKGYDKLKLNQYILTLR